MKEAAYASIALVQYNGKTQNFAFEMYVMIHQKAHMELERHGESVLESKKVHDFLMGIQDPQLAPATKDTAMVTMDFHNNFTNASNFLLNFVQSSHKIQKTGPTI